MIEFYFDLLRQDLYVALAGLVLNLCTRLTLNLWTFLLLTVAYMYFGQIHSLLRSFSPPLVSAEPFFPTSRFPTFMLLFLLTEL